MRLAAGLLALATLASGEERTVTLVNARSNRDYREMATVIRTVADISTLTIDSEHPAFNLQGSPAQLDAAEWLIHHLDEPDGWQPTEPERANPATREYHLPPTDAAGLLRIYYLPETATSRDMQETLTVLRTVFDVQKLFSYSPLHLLAYRGTPAELDAVEWVLPALDARAVSQPYRLPDGKPFDILRVFPLPPDTTTGQMQQLLMELRTRPISVMKVFTRSSPPAIAVRGTAAQIDQAEKLIPPLNSVLR